LRLLRLARLAAILIVVTREGRRLLTRHKLHYALLATGAMVVGCALLVHAIEEGQGGSIDSVGDALWWSITTVTTVGYGDTFPVTPAGRGVAAVLMATGIALFGVLTANLAALLVDEGASEPDEDGTSIAARLDRIEAQLAPSLGRYATTPDTVPQSPGRGRAMTHADRQDLGYGNRCDWCASRPTRRTRTGIRTGIMTVTSGTTNMFAPLTSAVPARHANNADHVVSPLATSTGPAPLVTGFSVVAKPTRTTTMPTTAICHPESSPPLSNVEPFASSSERSQGTNRIQVATAIATPAVAPSSKVIGRRTHSDCPRRAALARRIVSRTRREIGSYASTPRSKKRMRLAKGSISSVESMFSPGPGSSPGFMNR
jgi:Ion channel